MITDNAGPVDIAALGVLAEDVLSYAIVRERPEGDWATSTEIQVEFIDDVPKGESTLFAKSQAVVLDPSSGLAQGRIFDP